jgi:hypothetical protein
VPGPGGIRRGVDLDLPIVDGDTRRAGLAEREREERGVPRRGLGVQQRRAVQRGDDARRGVVYG